MSNLLSQASLVMIPSGYKEDVVYSPVPTDGSGDLSFTRASNGTRVNSAGLVEDCPWNLAQYSNDFSNGVWVTSGYGNLPTLTANSIANPVNGLTDAWTASFAAAGTQGRLLQTFTGLPVGVSYTYSMYIKAGTKTSVAIYSDTATVGLNAIFNLSNGTISSTSGTTATITAMTNGWYYVTITNNILSSGNGQYGIVTNTGEDGTLYIYGAQLNIGSTAKPYFPTTDRLNVPRLTYQNGGGGCPSLLLEKQSTNYLLYSEDLTQGDWSKQNSTVTGNATTSPDGTQNADKVIANTTDARHLIYQAIYAGVGTLTFTTYAKAGENSYLIMRLDTDSPEIKTWFNLSNGTIGTSAGGSPTITSVGNGWYRCSVTYSVTSGTTLYAVLYTAKTDGVEGFVGNNSDGTYMWGAQLEPSSYPTSYIPTTSSSATRVADACYKTGISSLIGQTEGTIFLDTKITALPTDGSLFGVQKTASNFVIRFGSQGSNIYAQCYNGSSNLFFESTSLTLGTRVKMAFAYKAGDYAFYVNGTQIATGTNATTIPACDEVMTNSLWGNTNPSLYEINEAVISKTRLTNAELAQLTA